MQGLRTGSTQNTHACMQAGMHACMHACTDACMNACMDALAHPLGRRIQTSTNPGTHIPENEKHTHVHAHTSMHVHTTTHAHLQAFTCTWHTCKHARRHDRTRHASTQCMHACMCVHVLYDPMQTHAMVRTCHNMHQASLHVCMRTQITP